ncbi:hypothetical protein FJTKL_04163 [Diaporthe vaccinii]|uniref:Uncharacterized protein n=1 Tax=Diaporthe vaccinii TaxID=105482 RepID=A0ABR4DTB9_9PEZI
MIGPFTPSIHKGFAHAGIPMQVHHRGPSRKTLSSCCSSSCHLVRHCSSILSGLSSSKGPPSASFQRGFIERSGHAAK